MKGEIFAIAGTNVRFVYSPDFSISGIGQIRVGIALSWQGLFSVPTLHIPEIIL